MSTYDQVIGSRGKKKFPFKRKKPQEETGLDRSSHLPQLVGGEDREKTFPPELKLNQNEAVTHELVFSVTGPKNPHIL